MESHLTVTWRVPFSWVFGMFFGIKTKKAREIGKKYGDMACHPPSNIYTRVAFIVCFSIDSWRKKLIAYMDNQFIIYSIPLGLIRVVYDSFPIGRNPNCFKQSLHSCIELVVILVKIILYAVCSVVSIREYPAFFTRSNANTGCNFNPMQRQITVCKVILG